MAFSQSALTQTIKLLSRNLKLFALIALSSMVLNSCLFLLFSFSIQSIIKDTYGALMQSLTSRTPGEAGQFDHVKQDMSLLLADEITFILVSGIIAFFCILSTIIVSAKSYIGKTMSLKELFSTIQGKWKRTLMTMFYSSGLSIAYALCLVGLILVPLIMYPNKYAILVAVVIGVPALLFLLYLSVTWILALVVSVVEEDCYGVDALARASRLAKGKKLQGFMLNLFFNIVSLILQLGYRMTIGKDAVISPTVYGVITVNVSSLLNISVMVVYSVFYYHCKKHHGEENQEIEKLQRSVEYTKLPTGVSATDIV